MTENNDYDRSNGATHLADSEALARQPIVAPPGTASGRGVIEKDGYDRFSYRGALDSLPDLKHLWGEFSKKDLSSTSLLEDLYASLYKSKPKILENSKPEAHRNLIQQVMDSLDYDRMRATTRLSRAGSAIGTLELGESLLSQIPEGQPKQDAEDGRGWQHLNGCGSPDEQGRKLRSMVRQARRRTEETLETMRALGWSDEAGVHSASDIRSAAELSRKLRANDRLRRIAELAGRMRRLALAKHSTRARRQPDEVVGIEVGRDLQRAVPSELALLCTPMRETVLLRWAQGQLLQFQMEGREKLGKGPIVVCVDTSSSMSGAREVWSKAVALGLMAIAHREKRAFSVVLFSSTHQCGAWKFNVGAPMTEAMECLGTFYAGGTDFASPLNRALALINTSDPFEKADIVFITDGEFTFPRDYPDKFLAAKREVGASLYSIYIGTRGRSLDPISDGVAYVPHLGDGGDAEALELAFGI